ncbi:MAG: hydroxyacid dehydrogenase [Conexivisphaerales archaeon]
MANGYKVLVCDHIDERGVKILRDAGLEVDYRPKITPEEVVSAVEGFDAVIVRSRTKVKADVIQRAAKLKVIGRAGVGLDNIDVDAAKQRGIAVYNSPESLTNAVAELALGLMIAAARGVGAGYCNLKNGVWVKESLMGTELSGKTVGIVGFGRIGRRLAELLKPFNVKVLAYDILPPDETVLDALSAKLVGLDELLVASDFISLHLPGGPSMRGFIGADRLSKMKKTSFIVNTSRGEVLDENALVNALKSGSIRGAALDVFAMEPPTNKELLSLDNIVFTPHIGGQTLEAQASAATIIAQKIVDHLSKSA